MKKIVLLENEYELLKDEKGAFLLSEVENLFTEYFIPYDYILGDYSYGKLRLKGFYAEESKNVRKLNNFKDIEQYIQNYCSYQCKHFILKKIEKIVK